jgi:hypothetical protein
VRLEVTNAVRPSMSPLITSELVGNFHEIQQEGHAIEGDLYATFLNPVPSTIPK